MKAPVRTFSLKLVDVLGLRVEDVDIQDIAHGLALCNRFVGQTRAPMSVAQHSVFVSRLVEGLGADIALQGLLHDASEAYLGDVTKWLKHSDEMAGFRAAEDAAQRVIYAAFGVPEEQHPAVTDADVLMVRAEFEMGFGMPLGREGYAPMAPQEWAHLRHVGHLVPWSWEDAELAFLRRYVELTRGRA